VYLPDITVWIDLLRSNSPSIRRRLSAHNKSIIGLSIIRLASSNMASSAEQPSIRTCA